jgi:hypothetical protein
MDFLAKIKNAAKTSNEPYINLLQQYKKSDKSIHLFHEGKDDPSFYTNFIKNILGEEYKLYFYNSGNKDKVLKDYKKINWSTYKKHRVLFFTDKDYSDILGLKHITDENIFVTKYYSIENYLVTKEVVERILVELISIREEVIIRGIIKDFDKQYSRFCDLIRIISAWTLFHKRSGREPVLQNIKLKDIFKFVSKNGILRSKSPKFGLFNYLDTKTKVVTPSKSMKKIIREYKQLKLVPSKSHIRGKYEVWFLSAYIEYLLKELNSQKKPGEEKFKMSFSLAPSNVIVTLGTRLTVPKDICSFLNHNFSRL